ncbi:MAG TPA: cyclodeaminase/cyclohydrolase family protein [Candidatus Omnitrophota bacterium]|nr:cyclodeaminase/cyclohydrolase family protein [Candidatus Omnitrophota bacterium]HPN88760.1 cyclodeaminase/cyclohydrolase family protein [Candidatus Omnitrophota bacterium]
MKKFKNFTIDEYLGVLSRREPVPGGGSVAALTAALGTGLICMVTNYSLNKGKSEEIENQLKEILQKSYEYQARLLELVDLDSEAYMKVVKTRKENPEEYQKALEEASAIPREICQLCYAAVDLIPFIVKEGNKNLIHDAQIASEMLLSAYNSALVLSNQ